MISSFIKMKKFSFKTNYYSSWRCSWAIIVGLVDFPPLEVVELDTLDNVFWGYLSILDTVWVKELLGFEIDDIAGLLRLAAGFFCIAVLLLFFIFLMIFIFLEIYEDNQC